MLTVYKYQFKIDDDVRLMLPADARILHVAMQFEPGLPCVWVLLDPTAPIVERRFRLAGTGHPIEASIGSVTHHGTFLMAGGRLVFHLFEIGG